MRAIRYLVVLSLLLSTAAFAGAREELNAFTNGLKGLDGQFKQTVYDVNGQLKETSSGRLALSAPRLFRWSYVQPSEQLVIAHGSESWVYEPAHAPAPVRPTGVEWPKSPLATPTAPAS